MYAKVFRQIYDSTLAEDWRALVTFQQLLVLADSEGMVDMTPGAIHRVTNIPQDIIDAGLERLQQPDPVSRSDKEEGRRIVLLDTSRNWGWRIVNHGKYKEIRSQEDRREYMRKYMRDYRKQPVNSGKPELAPLADTYTYTDTNTKKTYDPSGSYPHEFEDTWKQYPARDGDNPKRKAFHAWNARVKEGHTPDEMRQGVARYRAYCQAKDQLDTTFVMQAKRFFGTDKPFLLPWRQERKSIFAGAK